MEAVEKKKRLAEVCRFILIHFLLNKLIFPIQLHTKAARYKDALEIYHDVYSLYLKFSRKGLVTNEEVAELASHISSMCIDTPRKRGRMRKVFKKWAVKYSNYAVDILKKSASSDNWKAVYSAKVKQGRKGR